ncbi:uncharacterized protein LOC129602229 [Paramacrobiotus metropolitanus]|uniref:uncharacterized protein LOC129602229 n=1 Tax=Paramacrobiotus metropolitanus TaxID=2943436 RepID=UPI002445D8E4|nr:uncharacterized protein LOC129602229 [Paramacrobiotus metropolitanus]
MLAHWKEVPIESVLYSALTGSNIVISSTRANLGYTGAVFTVCSTIMLSLSIAGSLFVNRHWRLPKFTQRHLPGCGRVTAFRFDFNLDDDADPAKHNQEISLRSWCSVLGLLLLGVVTTICATVLWIIFCVLPVILLLAISLIVVVAEVGAEAGYPCWVGFACLLSLHCTGRIWGLWINDGYSDWMHKKIRMICGVSSLADSSESSDPAKSSTTSPVSQELKQDAHYESPPALPCMFVSGSLTVLYYAWELLFCGTDSIFGKNQLLTISPCTECCINDEAILSTGSAMASYWFEPYPSINNSHFEILTKYTPYNWELYTGGVFWFWSIVVVFASALPWIGVVFGALIALGVGLFVLARWFCLDSADENDGRITEGLWTQAQKEVKRTDTESNASQFSCACDSAITIVGSITISIRRAACWMFLPWPVLRLLLAERLQLPGLLMVMTGYLVWVYWTCFQDCERLDDEEFKHGLARLAPRRQSLKDSEWSTNNKPTKTTKCPHCQPKDQRTAVNEGASAV